MRRRWPTGHGTLIFVGLNPSRADSQHNDPTLRRLLAFARLWGFGDLVVLNLFARVSSTPTALHQVRDPIGCNNNIILERWLKRWAASPDLELWCGWGARGGRWNRDSFVLERIGSVLSDRRRVAPGSPEPFSIGLTRGGHPRHPLYAAKTSMRHPYGWASIEKIRHPEEQS